MKSLLVLGILNRLYVLILLSRASEINPIALGGDSLYSTLRIELTQKITFSPHTPFTFDLLVFILLSKAFQTTPFAIRR